MVRVNNFHFQQVSCDEKEPAKKSNAKDLIAEEEAKTGRVHLSILWEYCKACTWPMMFFAIFLFFITNVASVGSNFWLAAWSNAEDGAIKGNFSGNTACDGVNGTSM